MRTLVSFEAGLEEGKRESKAKIKSLQDELERVKRHDALPIPCHTKQCEHMESLEARILEYQDKAMEERSERIVLKAHNAKLEQIATDADTYRPLYEEAEAKLEIVRNGLLEYGSHKNGCSQLSLGPCDCGYKEILDTQPGKEK